MRTNVLIACPVLLVALALAGCSDESPEKRIESAKEHLQRNETKSAVIEIKNALQKNPDLGEARYLLGSTLLKEGNVVAAEVELRKALAAKYPADIVVPDLARSMLMLGQAKKVVEEFGSIQLGNAKAVASLQATLAAAYGGLGRPEQARAALAVALESDPRYSPALLVSARQKASARDYVGAIAVANEVIGREPGNSEAWVLKGDILLYAQGKPDEALAAYRKALEADPMFTPAHFAILTVLSRQGSLDEAAKQLELLKKFAAKNPQTRYFEAELAFRRQDFKRARDVTQQLLQHAPNNARVLQLAGAVELQAGAVGQAEIYLSKALQLAPELIPARRMLIATYLRSGQPVKALTALNAAAGKDGIGPSLYSLAGEVYLQNGDAKKAEEYFTKALKLDPDDARKRTALAITQLAGGNTDAAFDELQNIAATDKGITADLAMISALLRRKEFDNALEAIDKLEAKQPDKPIAANLRGRTQLALKNNAAARKSFERALTIDPEFFAAAASLAAMDMADKKPDEAKKRFEAMLSKNPNNGQALLAMARLAVANGAGKDEVAALLTKAVDANPTDVAPRLLLIDLLLRNKDNKQALAAAQSAVSAVPTSPELLSALGRAQLVSGESNQAAATYGKLVSLQPLSPQAFILLAEAQMANNDKRAASQSLRKALEIKPDQLDAQRRLIKLDVDARNYDDAVKIARTVQQQRPKSPAGYVFEGDIANVQEKWDAAARAYRAALQYGSASEIATKLHAVLLASGKSAEAGSFGSTWLREHPKDAVFMAYQGEQALAKKDYAAAERHYLAALNIQPNNALVLNNLAWVTGRLGKDGAVDLAEKANKLAPNQPALMDTLAMLLADKNEFSRALEWQNKAVGLQPSNAELRLNLAKIYIKSGDRVRAKAELETLVNLGNKSSTHAEVISLLQTL